MRLTLVLLLTGVSCGGQFFGTAGCAPKDTVSVAVVPTESEESGQQPPTPSRPRGSVPGWPLTRRVPAPISDRTGLSYHPGRDPYLVFVFDRQAMGPWRLRTPRGWLRSDYDFWQYGHRDERGELDIPAMGGTNTLTINAPRNLPVLLRFVLGPNDPGFELDRVSPDDNGSPMSLTIQRTPRSVYGTVWLSGGFHVIRWETSV